MNNFILIKYKSSLMKVDNIAVQPIQKLNAQTRHQTYQSLCHISLITWNLGVALFNFGYFLIYVTQVPIETIKKIYNADHAVSQSLLNGFMPAGGLIGALVSSFFLKKYSRRNNLLIFNALCFISSWLIFVPNLPLFIACRFFQGVSAGATAVIVPLMINELSPVEISGALGCFSQANICLGVFFGCFAPYLLLQISGDSTANSYWFIVFGIPQLIVLIQSLILLFVFPYQTPTYWLAIGNEEKALQLIALIYKPEFIDAILYEKKQDLQAQSYNLNESGVQKNKEAPQSLIKDTQVQLVIQITPPFFARDMLRNDNQETEIQNIQRNKMSQLQNSKKSKSKNWSQNLNIQLLISFHLAALQQFSGINFIGTYAQQLSSEITTGPSSQFIPSIINFVELPALIASYFLLKVIGRKAILLAGTVFAFVANAFIAIGFLMKDRSESADVLIYIGIFLYMIAYGFSLGPVVFLYMAQVISPNAISYAISVLWICAILTITLFPLIDENLLNGNPGVLFVFSSVFCFLSIFPIYFCLIETRNKTEKQIWEDYQQLKICQRQAKK